MITGKNIKKNFGDIAVLKGINIDIPKGEVVSITGASGAGKTTLLQILGTLMPCDEGEIIIDNQKPLLLNDKNLSLFRNQRIGFVFQAHHLLPEFTALENICIPAFIASADKKSTISRALDLLKRLNLSHRAHHKPNELSGGEQQRVAVARALINNPAVLLADEPSGNLDSHNKIELHELFFELRKEFGYTILIVTHDMDLAKMCDRTIVMADGLIISH